MGLEKKMFSLLKFGALAAMATPLIYNVNFIFPYVFLKNIVFRGLVLILLLTLVLYIFERNKWRGQGNLVFYGLLVFLFVLILASVFGVDPANSFWGGWERMDGLLNYLFLGAYFFILINTFTSKKDWIWLMRLSILVCLAVGFSGLIKHGLGISQNSWSTLGNSAFLGYYLFLNLGLVWIVSFLDKSKWRFVYGAAGLFFLLLILGAASRAPILGLLFSAFIFGILSFKSLAKKWRIAFMAAVFLVISLGALAVINRDSAWISKIHFVDRLAHISSVDPTAHNRLLVWESGWLAFRARPLLGYGLENISLGVNKYYNSLITEQWFDRTHNFVIDYLLSAGALGLLAYLFFIGSGFYYSFQVAKRNRALGHALSAVLAGMMVTLFFSFDTLNSWLVVVLILAFASWAKSYQLNAVEMESQIDRKLLKLRYPLLIAAALSATILFNATVIKSARANLMAGKAYRYSQLAPEKSVAYYDKIFALHTFGEREVSMHLLHYATTAINAPEAGLVVKKLVFEKAEEKALQYLNANPRSLQVRMGLAQLYLQYGADNIFYLNEAIDLLADHIGDSPGRVNIYFILASAYNDKGELDKAIDYLEQAYAVTKAVKSVYSNLMNLYVKKGETRKVDEIIKAYIGQFDDLSAEDYRLAAEYYFRADLFEDSKKILLEKAIPADPDSWRSYVSYASILEYEGKFDEAITYLEQALADHPDLSDVFGEYIEYLRSINQ